MDERQKARWQRIGRQFLWTVGVAVAVSAVLFVINHFYIHRSLWAWLKLLIVPAILAAGGVWFNQQQREREQDIAQQRARDEALQAYLDQMGQLLLAEERSLRRSKEGDDVRTLARSRTSMLLARLDGNRKGSVMQFLYESNLISNDGVIVELSGSDLSGADLFLAKLDEANLYKTNLYKADLRGADLSYADLSLANLSGADLYKADLREADLRGTNLSGADLSQATLSGTDLSQATLSGADLTGADLSDADLSDADLSHARLQTTWLYHPRHHGGADLSGADLSHAYLRYASVTEKQLKQAESLEGATMPGGSKHP